MYKYFYLVHFLLLALAANAQHDVIQKTNLQVKGYVRTMKVRSDMVRLVNDSLKYGENKGIHTYVFSDDNRIILDTSITDFNRDTVVYIYTYNLDGNVEFVRPDRNNGSYYHHNTFYAYNAGRLLSISEQDDSGKNFTSLNFTYANDSAHVLYSSRFGNLREHHYTYFLIRQIISP